MREPQQDPPALSPGAAELLDAWLQSQQFPRESSPLDTTALVRYQSGALGTDAVRSVEAVLVRDPAARMLLKTTRQELKRLRALPWSEAARQAGEDSLPGEVARAWMELTTASVASAAAARESWAAQGWTVLRMQAAMGVEAAKAAWANFVAFGDQLRYTLQAAPAAAGRSGSESQARVEGAVPSGTVGTLFAEVDIAGTLNATLSVQDAQGNASTSLDRSSVYLALLVNGQTWPLAPATVEGDKAVWALADAGRALGLPTSPIPAAFFRITIGEQAEGESSAPLRLMAEIADAGGKIADRVPVPLEIHDGPRWEAGAFHAAILIAGPVRHAYADYSLRLDVTVAGMARQCLGYWPLSDWSDSPRTVTADCPGSPDASVPYAAVLHATLQP